MLPTSGLRELLEHLPAEAVYVDLGFQLVLVGAANSNLGNIAFCQKCGFRMDHVRRNYFRYHQQPLYENGIRVQEMLVSRYELEG